MANENINIVMQLVDNVSANAQKIQTRLQGFQQSMKHVSAQLAQAGQASIYFGTVALAPVALALKSVESRNFAVREELGRTSNSFLQLQNTIATGAIPTIKTFNDNFGRVVNLVQSLNPKLVEQIAHWTMVGGAIFIVGGTLAIVTAKVIKLANGFLSLGIAMLNPGFLAFSAIIATVLITMQLLPDALRVVLGMIVKLQKGVADLFDGMSKIPKIGGKFKEFATSLRASAQELEKSSEGIAKSMEKLQPSNLAKRGMDAVSGAMKAFENTTFKVKQSFTDMATVAENAHRQVAQSLQNNLGTAIFNRITGNVNGLKETFRAFGTDVLQIMSNVMAKVLLAQTLGKFAGSSGILGTIGKAFTMHTGGQVQKAHSGLSLAPDEVPIIAQQGEGILSKQGMATLGSKNLQRLNRGNGIGGGGSSINFQPVMVIHAWDSQDVYRNRKMLSEALSEELRTNGNFRNVIKKYG